MTRSPHAGLKQFFGTMYIPVGSLFLYRLGGMRCLCLLGEDMCLVTSPAMASEAKRFNECCVAWIAVLHYLLRWKTKIKNKNNLQLVMGTLDKRTFRIPVYHFLAFFIYRVLFLVVQN